MRLTRLSASSAAVFSVASAVASAGSGDLSRFLVRRGEAPGFTPGKVVATSSLSEFVTGEPQKEMAADTKRYASEGFVGGAREPLTGARGAVGVSDVTAFATIGGAKREKAHLLDVPIATERLTVPGLPGARGFTHHDKKQKVTVSNIVWIQGRCVLVVGDLIPSATANTAPAVIAGAKAVHRRAGAACP